MSSFAGQTHVLEKISAGVIHGAQALDIVGVNAASTTSYETIWEESSAYSFLTSAMSSPYVSSSSTDDTSAGTGARTVRVSGVNTSFEAFTEDVTLNGQSSVSLTTTNVLAINKVEVLTAGSGGANAGIIRVGTGTNTSGVPAVKHAHMAVGMNVSHHGFYSVPADKAVLINMISVQYGSNSTGVNSWKLLTSENLGLVKTPFFMYKEPYIGRPLQFQVPLYLPEKTQFQVQARGGSATTCSVHINGILLDRSREGFSKWI